jgi:hypothetical protein
MKKKAFYGWKLLAAFWFIYLVNLGFPTYGQSVINASMAKDLHLDRTMLGLAFSLHADGGAAGTGGGGTGQQDRRSTDARNWKLLRHAGRVVDGAVRPHRLASRDLVRNIDWLRIVRGWSDRRTAGNRAMVRP